jgi:hypothetical protein
VSGCRASPLACARAPQAEECLRQEEERVDHYLHAATKPKLLKEVEAELLAQYEAQLLAKEHSGAAALLRDDKVWGPGAGVGSGLRGRWCSTRRSCWPKKAQRRCRGVAICSRWLGEIGAGLLGPPT